MEKATDTYWSDYRVGERFGRLTILGFAHRFKKKTYVNCRCDCGKECVVRLQHLVSGKTQSCGCLRHDSPKMRHGCYRTVKLGEEAEAWIIANFAETKNGIIKERYGVSDGFVHRFARKHGLIKSEEFMRRCQEEVTEMAKIAHRKQKYPPKGYKIPRSEMTLFQAGISNTERFGAEKELARKQKSEESRRKTIKLEKARVLFGIPQKTKMQLTASPQWVGDMRYQLRKHGYIIPKDELFNAYYTPETKRSARMEARKSPFRFYPLPEVQTISEIV